MSPFNTPCLRAALALCLWALWAAAPAPGGHLRHNATPRPAGIGPFAAVSLHAADRQAPAVETAEALKKTDGGPTALYRVMWTVLIIWTAISVYLYAIDRKISRLERELNER